MLNEKEWFTEIHQGAAFSLAIKSKLHEEQSPFQKLEVYETETFGNLLVLDGCYMVTTRDNFTYHEMMSHPALFAHPNPKHVAIIGGGDCGTLREVLKHQSVEKVTQIDIDERVTRVSETYFPELTESNDDPRAELLFEDGIKWIENAPANSLDVIIVDSTDPVGPGEVLFTKEFYSFCEKALRPEGIFVQQSESPLLHLNTIIAKMHRCLRGAGFENTQTLQFPVVVYPSGWWSCTMGSKANTLNYLRTVPDDMDLEYYSEGVHEGAAELPPFVERALEEFI